MLPAAKGDKVSVVPSVLFSGPLLYLQDGAVPPQLLAASFPDMDTRRVPFSLTSPSVSLSDGAQALRSQGKGRLLAPHCLGCVLPHTHTHTPLQVQVFTQQIKRIVAWGVVEGDGPPAAFVLMVSEVTWW